MIKIKNQSIKTISFILIMALVLTSIQPVKKVQALPILTEATSASSLAGNLLATSSGITIDSGTETYVGKLSAASTYSSLSLGTMGEVSYELGNGILVTSGDGTPSTSNTDSGYTVDNSTSGDSQLQTMAGLLSSTYDAFSLSFNFTVPSGTPSVKMDFMFGSEEYPDYMDSDYVDGAAVIVDGTNYAYFTGGTPLKVVSAAELNANLGLAIEYGGISVPKTITALLDPTKSVHTIKIVIADTSDSSYDSGLFLSSMRTSTSVSGGIGTSEPEPTPSVSSVDIIQNSVSVEPGYTTQLTANVTVEGGASQELTWTSSDTDNKVTVDETGNVSVVGDAQAGNYTITARSVADTSKYDTATIVVGTDSTAPTLSITKPASTASAYSGTTVSYVAADLGSGIKSYSYTYNGSFTYNGTEYTNQTVTTTRTELDNAVGTFTKTDETIPYGNYTLTVNVFDALDYSVTKVMNVNNTTNITSASPTITLGNTQVPYNGTEQKPSVDVKIGSTTLTQGTDYSVAYMNNVDAGTATLTITGKGAYSGTVSRTFTITPLTLTVTPDFELSKYYGQVDPVLTYTYSGNIANEIPGFSGVLSRTAGNTAGSYPINLGTLSLANNGAFKTGNYTLAFYSTTVDFTIDQFTPSEVATTNPDGLNNWFRSTASFIAPSGYTISASNALTENAWGSILTVDSIDAASKSANYYLKDSTGAISEVKSLSYKVDKEEPSNIQASYETNKWYQILNTVTFGLFFDNTVTVTLSAEDATSGVKDFTYTLDGQEAVTTTSTFQVSPEFIGNFSVYATDNAGNQSAQVSFENFVIDTNTPNAPVVSTSTYVENTWTSGSIAFYLSDSSAESGIQKYQYSTDGENWIDITNLNGTVTTVAATVDTPSNVTAASITVSDTQDSNYYFRTVSNSNIDGNSSAAIHVKIDKEVPGKPSMKQENKAVEESKWYKGSEFDVITQEQETSQSDVTTEYKLANSKNDENNQSEWIAVPSNEKLNLLDGVNEVQLRTVDLAGNTSDTVSYTIKVDTTKPNIPDISISGTNPSDEVTRELPTIDITPFENDETTSDTYIYFKIWSVEMSEPSTGTLLTDEDKPQITEDGNYTIKVWSEDEAGNVSDDVYTTMLVDTTAPTGEIKVEDDSWLDLVSNPSFDMFRNKSQRITITASDVVANITTSGVDKVEYLKATKAMTEEELKESDNWNSYNDIFSINPDDSFVVYAKISDNAGNVTYLSTNGYVLETKKPIISGVDDGKTYYASRPVTVTDENLLSVVVKVGDSETTKNVTNGTSEFALNNDGSAYTIIATDAAGNTTTYTVTCNETKSFVDDVISGEEPDVPTTQDTDIYKDLIGQIDDLLNDETTNLTVDEKQTLENKLEALVEDYRVLEGEKALVVSVGNTISANVQDSSKGVLQDMFTTEDAKTVLAGGSVKIELKIDKVDLSTITEAQRQQIEKNKEGLNVAAYLDISIMKNITDAGGNSSSERITNLGNNIRIVIDIPENLRGLAETYYIIRNHDGEITVLYDLDNNPNTITIETDRFSVYAFGYMDGKDLVKASSPQTGDSTSSGIFAAIDFLAILVISVSFIHRRRRSREHI